MNNSDWPLLTVITPTYNRAGLLPETIESVLQQDYPNLEYIVLDDGSTDETCEVYRHYAGRLHWETHANMGETQTVNKGWRMARGAYVTVVNSDDPLLPGMLHSAVRFMEKRPKLLVAYPDWISIDEHAQPIGPVQSFPYSYEEMLGECRCLPGPGALIRRRAFQMESARDPRYRYVADLEYWLRLGLHGPFARIPECLATHRVHADSAGVACRPEICRELLEMIVVFFAEQDLPDRYKNFRRQAVSSAYVTMASIMRKGNLPYLAPLLRAIRLRPLQCPLLLARHLARKRWVAMRQMLRPASPLRRGVQIAMDQVTRAA